MGKKQNPCLLRTDFLGWTKSCWFARNKIEARQYIADDYNMREYVIKTVGADKVSEVIIQRINSRVIATIYTHKMYYLCKAKDENTKPLVEKIQKYFNDTFKGVIEVKVEEVLNPDADANLIAGNIAAQITNRQNYKKAAKRAIRSAMRAGALGIRIRLSGRLGGVSIARTVQYTEGKVPLQTFKVKIDQATVQSPTSYGICGVKVLVSRN